MTDVYAENVENQPVEPITDLETLYSMTPDDVERQSLIKKIRDGIVCEWVVVSSSLTTSAKPAEAKYLAPEGFCPKYLMIKMELLPLTRPGDPNSVLPLERPVMHVQLLPNEPKHWAGLKDASGREVVKGELKEMSLMLLRNNLKNFGRQAYYLLQAFFPDLPERAAGSKKGYTYQGHSISKEAAQGLNKQCDLKRAEIINAWLALRPQEGFLTNRTVFAGTFYEKDGDFKDFTKLRWFSSAPISFVGYNRAAAIPVYSEDEILETVASAAVPTEAVEAAVEAVEADPSVVVEGEENGEGRRGRRRR